MPFASQALINHQLNQKRLSVCNVFQGGSWRWMLIARIYIQFNLGLFQLCFHYSMIFSGGYVILFLWSLVGGKTGWIVMGPDAMLV
jgi:hypothetical protein